MIALDTHAWLWWVSDPDRLGQLARDRIERSTVRLVSAISAWEIEMLVSRGRIRLDLPTGRWVGRCEANGLVEVVPVDAPTALRAARLGDAGFHPDPADRLIYATARAADVPLATRDERIRSFDPRTTVW